MGQYATKLVRSMLDIVFERLATLWNQNTSPVLQDEPTLLPASREGMVDRKALQCDISPHDPYSQTSQIIVSISIPDLRGAIIDPAPFASPCQFRLLDVAAFLDSHILRIAQYSSSAQQTSTADTSVSPIPPYATISYPWRDLQLIDGHFVPSIAVAGALHADPISIDLVKTACIAARAYGCEHLWIDRLCILQDCKEDKIWQIQRMFRIYKNCAVCLVFPGGLVRLPRLGDSTTWIDRAWTLQEAAAPGVEKVKVVFQLTHPSWHSYIEHRCNVEGYNDAYRRYLCSKAERESQTTVHGPFVGKVLQEGESASCDLSSLMFTIWSMNTTLRLQAPEIVDYHEKYPIRILRAAEAQMLSNAIDFGGLRLWIAAYTRSSSRPVDMVFSLMDLLGVHLDVRQFGKNDRIKATIRMIQILMERPKATATWLYIAPGMTPSKELSTLPEMPETSESGRAYINKRNGRVLAFEAIGARGANFWRSEGAPKGEMTDSGYFAFWAKAAPLVYEPKSGEIPEGSSWKGFDDRETWAVVVGCFKNLNRNPDTWRIQSWNHDTSPRPKGVYELTLMLIEKHGYGLYHRVGMEREVDERGTEGWNWTYRRFQVGGQGRGERKRFKTSTSGPIYCDGPGEEEEDTTTMRIA